MRVYQFRHLGIYRKFAIVMHNCLFCNCCPNLLVLENGLCGKLCFYCFCTCFLLLLH